MKIEMNRELTGWVMKITLEEERDSFGTEMIHHNPIRGLLGACIHNVDQCPLYLYEVGDRMLLSEYYKTTVCTMEDWKRLLWQLIKLLEGAADYFLSERDILLRLDTLFYDEKQQQLYAVYLDGYDGDVAKGIASIIEDFMNHMNHKDRELAFFVYGLHRVVKDSNFTVTRLKEYMDEYGKVESPKEEEDVVKAEEVLDAREEVPQQKVDSKAIEKRKKRVKEEGDGVPWLKAGIIVAMGVFFLLFAWKSEVLLHPITKEPDMKKAILFFGVLVVTEAVALSKECKGVLGRKKDLVLLSPVDKEREEIHVWESPCYIGSNSEQAQGIIDMSGISPVHIKIVIEEDKIYLIDQESDEGTWKNGKQLIPWERNPLQDGDTIRLSSVEYKVIVP